MSRLASRASATAQIHIKRKYDRVPEKQVTEALEVTA